MADSEEILREGDQASKSLRSRPGGICPSPSHDKIEGTSLVSHPALNRALSEVMGARGQTLEVT